MFDDLTIVAVGLLTLVCVIALLALPFVLQDEPEAPTVEPKMDAQRRRDATTKELARQPDVQYLTSLIYSLPAECRELRTDEMNALLTTLKGVQRKLKALEAEHGTTLDTSKYTAETYEEIERQYADVTRMFADCWQELATFREVLFQELMQYTPERVDALRTAVVEKLIRIRHTLAMYASVFDTTSQRDRLADLNMAFGHINKRLAVEERRSHAVRQLMQLNRQLDTVYREEIRTCRIRLAERHCSVLREIEEGIAWFEGHSPQNPRLERLAQLREILTQGKLLRNRALAVATLQEASAEVTDMMATSRIAHNMRTREAPLAMAA